MILLNDRVGLRLIKRERIVSIDLTEGEELLLFVINSFFHLSLSLAKTNTNTSAMSSSISMLLFVVQQVNIYIGSLLLRCRCNWRIVECRCLDQFENVSCKFLCLLSDDDVSSQSWPIIFRLILSCVHQYLEDRLDGIFVDVL